MPMHDWLHKYPGVQQLLQQDGDVLEGLPLEDDAPEASDDAITVDELLNALGQLRWRCGQTFAGAYGIRTARVREGHYVTVGYRLTEGICLSPENVIIWSPTIVAARRCHAQLATEAQGGAPPSGGTPQRRGTQGAEESAVAFFLGTAYT